MNDSRPEQPNPVPYPEGFWLRLISLLLALGLSGLVFHFSERMVGAGGVMSLMMLGIAAGFVHGVGFVPRHPLWRVLFHPVVGLLLMGLGFWFILTV